VSRLKMRDLKLGLNGRVAEKSLPLRSSAKASASFAVQKHFHHPIR
jgi:hypothetical protein